MALSKAAGVSVPDEITSERGRLLDAMTDMDQYFYGKKVALFGDPDQIIPLTEFLLDLGMKPIHIVSGTPRQKGLKSGWRKSLNDHPEPTSATASAPTHSCSTSG